MPRIKRATFTYQDTGQVSVGSSPMADLIRGVLATPGLPHTLIAALDLLGDMSRHQPPRPLDIIQSGSVCELIVSLQHDYGLRMGSDYVQVTSSPDDRYYLAAKQRCMKLRLLAHFCSILLPGLKSSIVDDLFELLCGILGKSSAGPANVDGPQPRPEEKHLVLSLLGAFLNKCADRVGERLGELLGYLTVLAAIHTSGQEGVSLVPTNLPHLHFTPTTSQPSDGGGKRESSSSCPETTSESEYSDSDMTLGDSEMRQVAGSGIVERTALVCLNAIVKKCPKKDVVSFWFVFLPDRCFNPLSAGVADLLNHPAKRVRQLASSILVDFLTHSVQFLALAQHQERAASYTALSTALAISLHQLHSTLVEKINQSLGPTELVGLLKLVATLCENTPYPRLAPGILDQLILGVMETAESQRNPVVQVAVLSVLVSACQRCSGDDLRNQSVRLFRFTMGRSFPDSTALVADNNVRYMALQALAVLTQIDIQIFLKEAHEVKKLIDMSLVDSDSSVVLHTFRFIKNFTRHLTEVAEKDSESRVKNMAIAFWIDFLKPANFQLLDKHTNANIKSAFCDCLAEMGSQVFSQLPEAKKIVCITFVLGQCSSSTTTSQPVSQGEENQDRAALSSCLRTLGIFVMFPSYLTDTAFHIDVADAVLPHLQPSSDKSKRSAKAAPDPNNKTVRVAASWALANLTDVILQAEKERKQTGEEEDFPIEIAKRILICGIGAGTHSSSAVNTKSNAVRCIGNMLNYVTAERVGGKEYQDLMSRGTKAIIANITGGKIMKVRWNACYAASNIMRKEEEDQKELAPWRTDLVNCLLDTVINFQNFKVRINAAVALGSITSRSSLGSLYLPVFKGLVASLETAQNFEVFGEWQHQANLVNQLCISLCRLLSLVPSQQEFLRLAQVLSDQWDLVEGSMRAAAKRISPEKFGPVLEAASRVKELQARSEEEQAVCQLFTECTESFSG